MTINRRQFLKSSAKLMTITTPPLLWSCASEKPDLCRNASNRYGVQLFMFRESFAKDPKATLTEIAAMGFNDVEPFGFGGFYGMPEAPFFGLTPNEMASTLKALGLATPTAHVNGKLEDNRYIQEISEKLNIQYFIEPLAEEFLSFASDKVSITIPDTEEKVLKMAERINQRGKRFNELGVGFAYHNHHMEFATIGQQRILDIIMQNTDPDYVKLELDLGWVAVADADPLETLKHYGNRVIGCHLKDRDYSIKIEPEDTDELMPEALQVKTPGDGDLDFAPIIAYLDEQKIQNRYVEVDVTNTPFEDAKAGLKHLRSFCR